MTVDQPEIDRTLRRFAAVELDALLDSAELLTRRDRKYVLDAALAITLLDRIGADVRVLEIDGGRSFRYLSTYFDTPGLLTYRQAAQGRPRRFKVRTRTYLDSGVSALEVKTRDRHGRTVKERLPYRPDDRHTLTAEARQFLAGFDEVTPHLPDLVAATTTSYRRSTLLLPGDSRVTIDRALQFVGPTGTSASGGSTVLLETKSAGRPTDMDRLLWSAGVRPVPVSKYCVGTALLHPGLAANRWHRVLRRHFDWNPTGASRSLEPGRADPCAAGAA